MTNPEDYVITTGEIDADTTLPIHMARGGGFAIRLQQKN
ncbi:MAG: glycoside hydrolase family 97 C-terminal domain-containing protein [Candidatus Amulumruptor sp.]|nr:glycoside hydrolase family 97 C-terminal domain-containing protein [Candidatus Amulumruptor sp.]